MFTLAIILLSSFNIASYFTSQIREGSDGNNTVMLNLNYRGEKFPIKYLDPDNAVPTTSDLNRYLNYLQRSINNFGKFPNKTDCNIAVSAFFSKSILKRTLLDYRNKLQSSLIYLMLKVIHEAEYILSHYIHRNSFYGWSDMEYRFSKLLYNDEFLVHNIGKFNRNRLQRWVLSNEYMHNFTEEMDEGTLPKEKYAELVESMPNYFVNLEDSDHCVSQIAYNHEPLDLLTTQPCLADGRCKHCLTSTPSVAYSLSHRMLNIYFRLKIRNCYIISKDDDLMLIDKLCAFMYREAVYIARRGFFARDLFLEHITLCSLLGYEEFQRQNWFTKALSWMNDHDCIKEFRNFEINRTKLEQVRYQTRDQNEYLKLRCEILYSACDDHPSALLMAVLSHAVRHAAHFMQLS